MDWIKLGNQVRESALDAHDGVLPPVEVGYSFLADNPECFGFDDWPDDLPAEPTDEFVDAYLGAYLGRMVA